MSFIKKICHAENSLVKDDHDRYLVYRRCAGMGDLLIGLYYAWRYAQATKRRLVVDWRWSCYIHNSTNLFSYLFSDCFIGKTALIGSDIENIKFPEPFYPPYLNRENINHPVNIYENGYVKPPSTKYNFQMNHGLCNLHPFPQKTLVTSESVNLFPYPVPEFNNEIRNFINIIWAKLSDHIVSHMHDTHLELFKRKTIGVHLRLGNNDADFNNVSVGRVKWRPGQDMKEYFEKEIIPSIEKFFGVYDIYIATDTEEAKKIAYELVPNCVIYDKYFVQYGCELSLSSIKNKDSHSLEIIRDSLTELFLLSQCDKIYSTFELSAFALISSLLNKKPKIDWI